MRYKWLKRNAARAWPYAPAVRDLHVRRVIRNERRMKRLLAAYNKTWDVTEEAQR